MRNLILSIVALAGCAASNQAVEAAKAARYRGDKLVLFNAARAATAEKYQLVSSDETTLRASEPAPRVTPL